MQHYILIRKYLWRKKSNNCNFNSIILKILETTKILFTLKCEVSRYALVKLKDSISTD